MAAEHTREEEELEEDTLFDQAGLLTNRIKKRSDTRTTSIGGKRITPMKTLSLCLAFFSLGLGAMIIEPTLFDLQRLIGTEIHVIALILVARAVGYILGSILGMILFERYNRQFILYLSMLAIMISLGLIPWCTSFVANFIVVTSLGIFMRILFAGGNVLCLDLWGRHSGPFLQAIHFSMGLGFFIAPLLSETILSEGISSSMPTNLPFLNLSVSPPLALPASSLQIERFHHNHNGIVMRLPRSIINDTVPTGTDSYNSKIVANNTAMNDNNQSTVTDFLKLEYTVAVTTESLISQTTTTAAALTGNISNTDLNSTAFTTMAPSGLSDSDIDDDRNETDSSLLTEVNSTITNSENTSLTSENRTTINNPITPEKTSTTTTTDSSAVVTHKPKPPFTDGNKLPKAKNSWVRKKEDMTEHVVNKPAVPTTSSSNIISTLPSTTKVADKNTSTVITELNNVTKALLQDKLPTMPSLIPNDTTLSPHLNFTQIESNTFNVTSGDSELVSNLSPKNESSSKGPVELPTMTIINSSSISVSNLLSESLKLNNTESSTVTVSSPIVLTDSTSNPLQITDPVPTTVPVVALNSSTNKGISIDNSSMTSNIEVASVNPVTTVSSASSSQNTPSTVSSQAPTVETLVMKSTFTETSKNNVTISDVLDGKSNSDFSVPPKENPKPISLINHQFVTQDPEMKTSLPLKSAIPSANYLDIPEPIPIEAASPKNDSTTEIVTETSTYFTKAVSLQRNDYLQNISHKKPFTFNNETEETQLFFGNFMHTVVDLGFSKLHVLYTIITLIVLLTSLVFLSFLCHNPRELRSKQEDEVKPGNQDDRFTYIMIGLMFFFYFSYTSCEVIFSQLFLGLLLESNMQVVLYKGSVLISVFWGIYAGTRGISICCANSFKPVVMILMDLVCCIVSSSALSIFNTEVEILLWCNMALMAFGLASIIPSSLMWLENFIHISNKAACVFLLGSALAEFFIALLMGHPFSLPTISCIYACLIFSIASLLIFGLMWRLASWRGEKYCFSKADVKYQLTSQVDEEEDAFELSSGNSSLYLLNNGNNNTNGHLMQEQNGSAFSVRNKKPYWK